VLAILFSFVPARLTPYAIRRNEISGEPSVTVSVGVADGGTVVRTFRVFLGIAIHRWSSNRSMIQVFPHVLHVFFCIVHLL